MTAALELVDLSVRFGGVVALDKVSFTLQPGELVGLIGPNGAGKTTLVDAVSGFTRYEGSVSLAGSVLDGLRPDQRVAHGLGRTFQSLELFEDLTVRENVAVGPRASTAEVEAALTLAGGDSIADRLPSTLSQSDRRLVALARALAAQPRVLLLDEIGSGADRDERSGLATRLRRVAASGTAILLIDHDLGFITDLAARLVVLHAGRVIGGGTPAEVRRDETVVAAYLGRQ